jgi:hypothetical protein
MGNRILDIATKVFDVLWLALLSLFPEAKPLLAQNKHGLTCPFSQLIVEESKAGV